MTIATSQFAELLWPGIKDIFGEEMKEWPSLFTQYLEEVESDKRFEKFQGVTGYQNAAVKNEGAGITYDDPMQGFQKEAVAVTYGLGAKITMEMMADNQYSAIKNVPKQLAKSYRHTQETVSADLLNSGFSTAANPHLTADGLSIFNTAHLLVDGGTYRNTPATGTDLTMTALENAYIDISDFKNDRSQPMHAKAVKLMVPTALQHTARKILETEYAVGSADNDKNVVSKANTPIELIVNPYLTDPDAWFLITDSGNGLTYVNRMAPQIDRDNQFNTKDLCFSVVGRFDVVGIDGRGMYGSPGA
jgi:hypothetical protein